MDRLTIPDLMGRPRTVGWPLRAVPFDEQPPDGEALITKTTITECPSKVEKGEGFNVKGRLVVRDTGTPLEAATIKFAYNGNNIGTDLTDAQGVFQKTLAIDKAGTFNLSARFEAIPGKYGPSSDYRSIEVTGLPPPPPPEPGEGTGEVLEISLPLELEAGKTITGYVRVRNNGDRDSIRLVETRVWSGKQVKTTVDLERGYVMKVPIEVNMPNENAKFILEAQHLKGTEYVTDHTDKHTVNLIGGIFPTEWLIVASVLGATAIVTVGCVIAYQEYRRREEFTMMALRR